MFSLSYLNIWPYFIMTKKQKVQTTEGVVGMILSGWSKCPLLEEE